MMQLFGQQRTGIGPGRAWRRWRCTAGRTVGGHPGRGAVLSDRGIGTDSYCRGFAGVPDNRVRMETGDRVPTDMVNRIAMKAADRIAPDTPDRIPANGILVA